jgi:hypothetical protein
MYISFLNKAFSMKTTFFIVLIFALCASSPPTPQRGASPFNIIVKTGKVPLWGVGGLDVQSVKIKTGKAPLWGFYAHRRINEMAVYTLPEPMLPLFKTNISYLAAHAIDPDKRRYIVPTEGYRHYLDMDRFAFLPQDFWEALILHSEINILTERGDTLQLIEPRTIKKRKKDYFLTNKSIRRLFGRDSIVLADTFLRRFYQQNLYQLSPVEPMSVSADSLQNLFKREGLTIKGLRKIWAVDRLSASGILPYHLQRVQRQLTEAFIQKNKPRILKLAAEMGHYLSDAHVPLHTTQNYDGQLTKQIGIHAFWESRLPELFTEAQYDFFVGKATYIENTRAFFWQVVEKSHSLVPRVLAIERDISQLFTDDKKFCLNTVGSVVKTLQCPEYAAAYHQRLDGMVEAQMQAAVAALGSAWYTAWVDAGQPDLTKLLDSAPLLKEEARDTLQAARALMPTDTMLGRKE